MQTVPPALLESGLMLDERLFQLLSDLRQVLNNVLESDMSSCHSLVELVCAPLSLKSNESMQEALWLPQPSSVFFVVANGSCAHHVCVGARAHTNLLCRPWRTFSLGSTAPVNRETSMCSFSVRSLESVLLEIIAWRKGLGRFPD